MKLRPSVVWFAQLMELRLRAHDRERGRAGWRDTEAEYLLERLAEESAELRHALGFPCHECGHKDKPNAETARIIGEAADVANFAMMIADNARRG